MSPSRPKVPRTTARPRTDETSSDGISTGREHLDVGARVLHALVEERIVRAELERTQIGALLVVFDELEMLGDGDQRKLLAEEQPVRLRTETR